MRYIKNVVIRFAQADAARSFATMANAAEVDTDGVYTSAAHFLCGENAWGFHNDMHFTMPISRVRLGMRIMEAAEKAKRDKAEYILLDDELHAALMHTLAHPTRFAQELPIPPALARAIVPIMDAIESATTSLPEAAPAAAAESAN